MSGGSELGKEDGQKSSTQNAPSGAVGHKTFLIVVVALIAVIAVSGVLFYTQYSSLQSNYNTLLSQKDALQANYTTLQNNYNALLNNFVGVQEENAQLDDIVNLRKSVVLLEDSFVEIAENGSLKLQYLMNYSGYLDLNIVSANSLYVIISNSDYNTTVRLPLEGVSNMLNLRVAILPGNTEVEIFNNDSGTAFVTINIDYTY